MTTRKAGLLSALPYAPCREIPSNARYPPALTSGWLPPLPSPAVAGSRVLLGRLWGSLGAQSRKFSVSTTQNVRFTVCSSIRIAPPPPPLLASRRADHQDRFRFGANFYNSMIWMKVKCRSASYTQRWFGIGSGLQADG